MDVLSLRTEFTKQIKDADSKIAAAENSLKQLQDYKTKLLGGMETLDLLEPQDNTLPAPPAPPEPPSE